MPDNLDPDVSPELPDEPCTRDLLDKAREGDSTSWDVIYRRYRVRLLLDVRSHLRGRPPGALDEEDIVQSAFVAAWDTIRDFEYRGEGSFRAWLRKLVTFRTLGQLRSLDKEDRHMERLATAREDPVQDPRQLAEHIDDVRRLLECLEELPEGERDILVMRAFENKRWAEVAECCGRSKGYVKQHYGIAFRRLSLRLGGPLQLRPPRTRAAPRADADADGHAEGADPTGEERAP